MVTARSCRYKAKLYSGWNSLITCHKDARLHALVAFAQQLPDPLHNPFPAAIWC